MAGNVVCEGRLLRIKWAIRANGKMPAKEFYYRELDDRQQARLFGLFSLLGDTRRISNPEHFKAIENTELWEFKHSQVRLPCFYTKFASVVITHGFFKKGRKIRPGEIERAEAIRAEYLEGGWEHRAQE